MLGRSSWIVLQPPMMSVIQCATAGTLGSYQGYTFSDLPILLPLPHTSNTQSAPRIMSAYKAETSVAKTATASTRTSSPPRSS